MKKHLAIIALLACPSLVMADNYATCLLDKLPGVQNQGAIGAAYRLCNSEYPGGMASVEHGAGLGLFAAYSSSDECILDKAKDTRPTAAVQAIGRACIRLYNKPAEPDPVGTKYYRAENGTTRKLVPFDGEFTPIPK